MMWFGKILFALLARPHKITEIIQKAGLGKADLLGLTDNLKDMMVKTGPGKRYELLKQILGKVSQFTEAKQNPPTQPPNQKN